MVGGDADVFEGDEGSEDKAAADIIFGSEWDGQEDQNMVNAELLL